MNEQVYMYFNSSLFILRTDSYGIEWLEGERWLFDLIYNYGLEFDDVLDVSELLGFL